MLADFQILQQIRSMQMQKVIHKCVQHLILVYTWYYIYVHNFVTLCLMRAACRELLLGDIVLCLQFHQSLAWPFVLLVFV